MEEEIHFDRPYMDKYRHNFQLMADFQFFADGYWFKTGNYPTEEMFNKFVINNDGE
jgi:hypothetical protein